MAGGSSASGLVGRAAELLGLAHALDDASAHRAVVVDIFGEPGVGRSRLLAAGLELARDRGLRVASARAAAAERGVPLALWAEALAPAAASLRPARLRRIEPATRAALAEHLPALEDPAAGAPAGSSVEPERALLALLEALVEEGPLVVGLDDVHWADAASCAVLQRLAVQPPPIRLLVLTTRRPGPSPPHVRRALAAAVEMPLEPLDPAAVRALVGDRVDELMAETGGNPFLLEQLARVPAADARGALAAPPAVVAALAEELTDVSPDARAVLDAAAVLAGATHRELLGAVAAVPPERLGAAVEELLELGLLRGDGAGLRIRHRLIGRAAYAAVAPVARLRAHRRAIAALHAATAAPAALAPHLAVAAPPGDATAVELLVGAAKGAAPAVAAEWLEAAVRMAPADVPAGRLRARWAAALGDAGRRDACASALEPLLAGGLGHDAVRGLGDAGWLSAGLPPAGRVVAAARAELPPAAAPALAAGRYALALLGSVGGDDGGAGAMAPAAALAAAPGVRVAREVWAAVHELVDGTPTAAAARAGRTLAAARRDGQAWSYVPLGCIEAVSLAQAGRIDDAVRAVERAQAACGEEDEAAWLALARALVALAAGDPYEALAFSAAAADGLPAEHAALVVLARAVGADAQLAADGAPTTGASLPDDLPRHCGIVLRARLAALRSRLVAASGDLSTAATEAGRALALSRVPGGTGAAVAACSAAAEVALAKGDASGALALARTAVTAAGEAGAVVAAGRARALCGRALLAAGERDGGIGELRAARDALAAAGARGWCDAAARELRAQGVRAPGAPRPATTAAAGLTAREHEVAALVAAGHSNREVAARLHLSVKTVETHLTRILRKLELPNRAALAGHRRQGG